VDLSPGGAGGVNGSRFPLDRARVARLLGFSELVTHTRDAMWQTDGLSDLVSHAAIAATGASRFAEDLETYGSDEFGLLRIGDELCRASALMPQKRNPYGLAVLRGGAGTLIGRATGVMATQRTPSGRTDNLLYAYGEVSEAVELAARLLRLAAATAESVTVDAEQAARRVRDGFALATDVAEAISLTTGLDYRAAYRVVGRAVGCARSAGSGPRALDVAAIDAAARELLGRPVGIDAGLLAQALDPAAALAARTVPGGAAPERMDAMLAECRAAVADARHWSEVTRAATRKAEDALLELARRRAGER
jgi:argininosuccinate lyase